MTEAGFDREMFSPERVAENLRQADRDYGEWLKLKDQDQKAKRTPRNKTVVDRDDPRVKVVSKWFNGNKKRMYEMECGRGHEWFKMVPFGEAVRHTCPQCERDAATLTVRYVDPVPLDDSRPIKGNGMLFSPDSSYRERAWELLEAMPA